MWSNHEIFQCTGGPSQSWGSAAFFRMKKQFQMVPDALISGRVNWIQQYLMDSVSAWRHSPDSERLLAQYRAYYGNVGGQEYIRPVAVSWTTAPYATYADTAPSKLFDQQIGDIFSPNSNDWVGVYGSVEMIIDAGANGYTFDSVAVHLRQLAAGGKTMPRLMTISYSPDGTSWTQVSQTVPRPCINTCTNSEGVGSNGSPLGVTGRYLKIQLTNGGWTFMSDVEVFGVPPQGPNPIDNRVFIQQTFLDLLDRAPSTPPEYDGWKYWLDAVRQGTSQTALLQAFITSNEFAKLIDIADDTQFVAALYTFILGRDPDSGGLNYWVSALQAGSVTRVRELHCQH